MEYNIIIKDTTTFISTISGDVRFDVTTSTSDSFTLTNS